MFALPNVEIRDAIDVEGFSLASARDDRTKALARKHPRFGSYLKRFKNEFGEPVIPSILMMRSDAPDNYRSVEAIARFRDAIAIAYISRGWAVSLKYGNNFGIKYSDYFYVFPWMVDKQYDGLIARTLDTQGFHQVQSLRAQSLPGLSTRSVDMRELDRPLLTALLERWRDHFIAPGSNTQDAQLFRSLNMANAAARMPAGADFTMLDIGRSVALWASAFEILAPSNSNAFKKVYALLESVTWNLAECMEKKYRVYGKDENPRSLPVWIFGEINSARNDYLHGNPLTENRLVVQPAKQSLHLYTAPLYRMALSAFLDLKNPPRRKAEGQSDYDLQWVSDFEFGRYQRDIESALSTIMTTDDERRAIRSRRVRDRLGRTRDQPATE